MAAPLHRVALVQSHYSRETFYQSLRTGIDPAGVVLDAAMPRDSLWRFVTGR